MVIVYSYTLGFVFCGDGCGSVLRAWCHMLFCTLLMRRKIISCEKFETIIEATFNRHLRCSCDDQRENNKSHCSNQECYRLGDEAFIYG